MKTKCNKSSVNAKDKALSTPGKIVIPAEARKIHLVITILAMILTMLSLRNSTPGSFDNNFQKQWGVKAGIFKCRIMPFADLSEATNSESIKDNQINPQA